MSKPSQSLADPAQVGFAKASNYDKYRPDYTGSETEFLLSTVGVLGQRGATILDLAAGTGLFTEALAARPEGFRIVAVEPHDDMRGELERKNLPGVEVRKGWGSDIPSESGELDAVFAAQVCYTCRVLISSVFLQLMYLILLALNSRHFTGSFIFLLSRWISALERISDLITDTSTGFPTSTP
jgi:hypothetical protein